ncbi:hypothetical protein GTP56_03830 [Duganella sp. FT134W]|uniref:Uncharacterized protein n=1 Tax=Duganella margarita TaxID=2692170 RepID=A0A7X4GZA2_9BURK|nr:hypothetical protein [Duganella margarita]MYM71324.1 hypothetical protein [Duganella margarita]
MITLLVPLAAFATTDHDSPNPSFGTQLSGCSAFFNLLSQSKSEFSEGMKGFAFAATNYSIVAFADASKAEVAAGKSMLSLADEFPNLMHDKAAFEKKFLTCVATLKTAELELRPRMDSTTKELVPEIFGEK